MKLLHKQSMLGYSELEEAIHHAEIERIAARVLFESAD